MSGAANTLRSALSMQRRGAESLAVVFSLLASLVLTACTGGQEGSAAETQIPRKNPIVTATGRATAPPSEVDVAKRLQAINSAIPIYAGARYRDDLTRHDAVMIKNQYGPTTEVYTLATNDSYPQVYHYYTTYLAQFRGYPVQPPLPPEQQNWRSIEVQLNQAMQDSFIPGDAFAPRSKQILLQVTETEAEPKTVIRYIITNP